MIMVWGGRKQAQAFSRDGTCLTFANVGATACLGHDFMDIGVTLLLLVGSAMVLVRKSWGVGDVCPEWQQLILKSPLAVSLA